MTEDRNKEKLSKGTDIAMSAFNEACQKCENDDVLAGFVRVMCTLSAKTIHGMDGKQFKKEFLRAAIADNEKITPQRVQ